MKKLFLLPVLFLLLLTGCSSDDDSKTIADDPSIKKELLNVSYGSDAEQKIDIYLPAGRSQNTKVIVLLHGGSWIAGNKSDMTYLVPSIQQQFPNHAIVNINYRLATENSPAFPKQISDIQEVIKHLEKTGYKISDDYAFIGFSAGGHLALLYSYAYDPDHHVKAICDVVGPADFSDPNYLSHPLFSSASQDLIGTSTPTQEQILAVKQSADVLDIAGPKQRCGSAVGRTKLQFARAIGADAQNQLRNQHQRNGQAKREVLHETGTQFREIDVEHHHHEQE